MWCRSLFLHGLDHLALRADNGANHLLRNLDSHQTRHVRLIVLAGGGDSLGYDAKYVHTSLTGLLKSLLKHLVAQAIALDVHLGGGDTVLRAPPL